LVFSSFSKKYSILGNELKEKFIIKIKRSDERRVNRVKLSLLTKGQSQWVLDPPVKPEDDNP